jgi:predicted kinase
MAKELFLLRGLPGSGKSTLAAQLGGSLVEADRYFMQYGEYKFDASKLKEAHAWCRDQVRKWMEVDNAGYDVDRIVVSNTFTQEWEMKPYYELAEKYGYRVYSIVVENRHGGKNVHNVPDEAIDRMRKRFEIKL